MFHHTKLIGSLIFAATLATGCGGNKDSDFDMGTAASTGTQSTGTSKVSFLPKAAFESFSSFSGASEDHVYQSNMVFPFIFQYLITPISASSHAPVSTAKATDYLVTIDEVPIDANENFPMLQKVIGAPVALRTALVFDVSRSVDPVDMGALVSEAKRYLSIARDSKNPAIANQEYVIWVFAEEVRLLIRDATSNATLINRALDDVTDLFSAGTLGSNSNVHGAILQAVGRFSDGSVDYGNDGDNDLYDTTRNADIRLSQLVLFSSGTDTYLQVPQSQMLDAIRSQGFAKPGRFSIEEDFIYKPVIYYVVGGNSPGAAYPALADSAEKVTPIQLRSGAYRFAEDLVSQQIKAMDARIDLDHLYIYRYAFTPRAGYHEALFQSQTGNDVRSLRSEFMESFMNSFTNLGTPAEELSTLVEITGPRGEYLPLGRASFAQVKTFGPATRWINQSFDRGDYEWAILSGDAQGKTNSNGTYTLSRMESDQVVLQLRNTALSGRYANKNTTTIVISR